MTVTRNGRTVWLTWKQFSILCYIERSEHRNRRLRLADIAKACKCSTATVSRVLVRFDLWRFIDYVALVGRAGGAWVMTRIKVSRSEEAEANLARGTHTYQSRRIARTWLATRIRIQQWADRRKEKERKKTLLKLQSPLHSQWVVTSGSMDAMFSKS